LEVAVRLLPPGGAAFLKTLIDGETLGAAAATVFAETPSFDFPGNIAGMIEAGAFTANSPRRSAVKPDNPEERGGVIYRLTTMIDQAVGIIRWIAQPSLTQLMLRLALAVSPERAPQKRPQRRRRRSEVRAGSGVDI
jgi:hypothetical protein